MPFLIDDQNTNACCVTPQLSRRAFANSRLPHRTWRLPGTPHGMRGSMTGASFHLEEPGGDLTPPDPRFWAGCETLPTPRASVIHEPPHHEIKEAMCSSQKRGLWPPDTWLPGPAPFLQTWETFVSVSLSFQHIVHKEYSFSEDFFLQSVFCMIDIN